jgi:hypothetical protein
VLACAGLTQTSRCSRHPAVWLGCNDTFWVIRDSSRYKTLSSVDLPIAALRQGLLVECLVSSVQLGLQEKDPFVDAEHSTTTSTTFFGPLLAAMPPLYTMVHGGILQDKGGCPRR